MKVIETPRNQPGEPTLPIEDIAAARSEPPPDVAVLPPRRVLKTLALSFAVLLGLSAASVLVWKFLSYVPFVLPSAIALGHIIFKDWHSFNPPWKRWPIIGMVVAAGVGGVAYQSHQLHEKAVTETTNKATTERLQGKVDATLEAQKNNTEVFANSFKSVSGELADLKTKVATEALRQEITSLQAKLEEHQESARSAEGCAAVHFRSP
jgi:hypothetical protein